MTLCFLYCEHCSSGTKIDSDFYSVANDHFDSGDTFTERGMYATMYTCTVFKINEYWGNQENCILKSQENLLSLGKYCRR